MTLLLIRHATAAAHGLVGGDFVRNLVEKGHEQSQRIGKFLKKHELTPDIVLSSPVLRAKETAEILAGEGCPKPVIESWLACGMRPETALRELKAYHNGPDMSILLSKASPKLIDGLPMPSSMLNC